jgi:hypothetical protein
MNLLSHLKRVCAHANMLPVTSAQGFALAKLIDTTVYIIGQIVIITFVLESFVTVYIV